MGQPGRISLGPALTPRGLAARPGYGHVTRQEMGQLQVLDTWLWVSSPPKRFANRMPQDMQTISETLSLEYNQQMHYKNNPFMVNSIFYNFAVIKMRLYVSKTT